MTTPSTSLRERSKAKRRKAIQLAAMRLFAERGYDGTTIAEIADAAEVAPRTISMYFPTKVDIALATSSDTAARLTATFQDHPTLSCTEVVDRWLSSEIASMDLELAAATSAMFEANPGLRAASNDIAEAVHVGRSALIAEIGLPPGDPMLSIILPTVGAAITEYLNAAMKSEPAPDLHRSFMRYLRAIIAAAQPT